MELAVVLTAAGAAGAAALVTTLIQLLKGTPIPTDGNEKLLALVFSAIITLLAVISVGVFTLPALFAGFVAWLAIAKLSTGIYDEVARKPGAFTEREPDADNPPL